MRKKRRYKTNRAIPKTLSVFADVKFFDALILLEILQEFLDALPQDRMDEMAINLSQGDEDELAFLNPWVRDGQFLRVDDLVVEEKKIEIEGTGPPPKRFSSAQSGFYLLHRSEEIRGFQVGLDLNHPIDKPILGKMAHRLSLVEGGFCQEGGSIDSQDLGDTLLTSMSFVTDVRADTDVGDVSHSERREEVSNVSLLGSRLFRFFLLNLFGCTLDLFLVFGRRLFEVADPFAKPLPDLGEFASAEDDQDDDQDDQQLRHSNPEHCFSSSIVNQKTTLIPAGSEPKREALAEANSNRNLAPSFNLWLS
jgi:hypothetical protein